MRCSPRLLFYSPTLVSFCVSLFVPVALSVLPSRACGATERFPQLAWHEDVGAGEVVDLPLALAIPDPPSPQSKELAQQTTEVQIQQLAPSGPRFRVMLAAGAGYGANTRNLRFFGPGSSGGIGGGTIRVAYSNAFCWGLSYRRRKLNDSSGPEATDKTGDNITWDISLDEMLFVFCWTSSPENNRALITYAELGAGAIKWAGSATRSDGSKSSVPDESKTAFASGLTIGGIMPLSGEIGLNIEGDWIITSLWAGAWDNLFSCRIGLAVMLGGR